jgi:hypothetical protein
MESTYPFRIGAINWNGVAMNAVIITGLTREDEDSFIASEVNHQILANNLEISAAPAKWAVFVASAMPLPTAKASARPRRHQNGDATTTPTASSSQTS